MVLLLEPSSTGLKRLERRETDVDANIDADVNDARRRLVVHDGTLPGREPNAERARCGSTVTGSAVNRFGFHQWRVTAEHPELSGPADRWKLHIPNDRLRPGNVYQLWQLLWAGQRSLPGTPRPRPPASKLLPTATTRMPMQQQQQQQHGHQQQFIGCWCTTVGLLQHWRSVTNRRPSFELNWSSILRRQLDDAFNDVTGFIGTNDSVGFIFTNDNVSGINNGHQRWFLGGKNGLVW